MSDQLVQLFSDGLGRHTGIELKDYPGRVSSIFKSDTTDSPFVDVLTWELHGAPTQRNPGEPYTPSSFAESFGMRCIITNYGMVDYLPLEFFDWDRYGILHRVLPKQGGSIARSFRNNDEILAASYLANLALGSASGYGYATSDGYQLCSTAHPMSKRNSTVWANRPATEAPLGLASLDAGIVNIQTQKAADGINYIDGKPSKLLAHPSQWRTVTQLLEGQWEIDSATRNENWIGKKYSIEPIFWPYWTVAGTIGTAKSVVNGWLLLGEGHSLRMVTMKEYAPWADRDWSTNSMMFGADRSVGFMADDGRHLYGSAGN